MMMNTYEYIYTYKTFCHFSHAHDVMQFFFQIVYANFITTLLLFFLYLVVLLMLPCRLFGSVRLLYYKTIVVFKLIVKV